jgi:hypothetical protein
MLVERLESFDDPFRRIESELAGLLGRIGLVASVGEGRLIPPVEILGADSEFVVRAERRVPTTEQGEYLRREFAYGTFEWDVVLPSGIDPEKVSARYEAGNVENRVPHVADKAVKVPVRIGSHGKQALKAAS